jgi:high-affinity iron transporter
VLATFVIALREGLEAALIVSIIAAFLRKNGKSLSAMWAGVALAVLLSIIVGVGLDLTERALPQASQEFMESIIGLVAVFFVTGMVMWMNTNAKNIKKELETEAAQAISQSSAFALASMAFLAVLKEGFETSVFLLATFSVAQSAMWAAIGAVVGLIMAVVIGWGLYVGGIRINLARFFRFTGMFLILVAAGLIISSLRSAHEAGWLNVGQARCVDLTWLVPPGTVRSALITGVLGMPADPRQIEIVGWLLYIVLVAVVLYWPAKLRPSPKAATRSLFASAGTLAAAAVALFCLYPQPQLNVPDAAPLVNNDARPLGQASLTNADGSGYQLRVALTGGKVVQADLKSADQKTDSYQGVAVKEWNTQNSTSPDGAPAIVTLDQVMAFNGNRIPIGLNPGQHPGPYNAKWTVNCNLTTRVAQGTLLSSTAQGETLVTLTGSGLQSPRTLTVRRSQLDTGCGWQVSAAYQQDLMTQLKAQQFSLQSYVFWAHMLPAFLAALAIIFLVIAQRSLKRLRQAHALPQQQMYQKKQGLQ